MSTFDPKFLIESSVADKSLSEQVKPIIAKWEKSGLLEGDDLTEKTVGIGKSRMALILENQAKRLLFETSQTGTGAAFTPGQGEQWTGIALPLVRKIFADISSKEFVSVQPMNLPSGLVFYLDFQYGTAQPFTGTRFNPGDSMYGITSGSASAAGGLYGAGRFGYSINEATASVNFATSSAALAVYKDVNFNSAYSASILAAGIVVWTVSNASIVLPNLDPVGVRSFSVTSSQISESNLLPEFTTYNANTDVLKFVVIGGSGSNTSASVMYSKQPTDNSRGDFEDTTIRPLTGSAAIPEVNLNMTSVSITAKTRKLKAKWTPEFSQDLNAYQSLDAESEITSILTEYIAAEIDMEIIDMLIEAAPTVDYWSANPGSAINATQTGFTSQAITYTSQGAWFQTLGTKIQKVSNIIHQKTLRGGANFLILSPTVSTILESIPGYAADTNGDKFVYAFGVQKAGMLNSRQKVYKNPYLTENCIVVGYRGTQFLETGAVYAPYIPLLMTPLVYDPVTFTPTKGLMTRYAKKVVRPEFYGKVFVEGLQAL